MSKATSARSRLGAVAWSLSYLVLGYVGMLALAGAGWTAIGRGFADPGQAMLVAGAIQSTAGILVFGLLTWLIGRRIAGLSYEELGWARPAVAGRGFGRAFAVGLVIAVAGMALGLPAGSGWLLDGGSFGSWLGRVALLAVALLPPAFMEELAFRGAAVALMARGIGRTGAIVVTAVLFAAAHRSNPEVTPQALGNIALAGVFLGLTFFAPGGLATATGAHFGWNLALAGAAAPVSGLPFEVPWIDFRPGAPGWLTGGSFGPEGGVLGSLALAIGIFVVWRWRAFREAT